MKNKIIKIFTDNSSTIDIDSLNNNKTFSESGIDSLDIMNIFLEVEQEFGITIDDNEYESLVNLDSLVKVVQSKCE